MKSVVPPVREHEVITDAIRQVRQRKSARFLLGPIPVPLIAAAGELPGRALLVLLAIRHRLDLTNKPVVSLPASTLAEFGFDKDAKARALHELERAGLIQVSRARGRAALITLVPPTGGGSVLSASPQAAMAETQPIPATETYDG